MVAIDEAVVLVIGTGTEIVALPDVMPDVMMIGHPGETGGICLRIGAEVEDAEATGVIVMEGSEISPRRVAIGLRAQPLRRRRRSLHPILPTLCQSLFARED